MGMTELGKRTFEMVKAYGLGAFYDVMAGNLAIEPQNLTVEVMNNITRFLRDHDDWVMGVENIGDGEYLYYVTEIEFLAECGGYIKDE